MRRLLFVLVVLVVGVAALGYHQGWFTVSADNSVTVDKEKLKEDQEKAKAKLEGLKGQAEAKAEEFKKDGTAKATADREK
jgi:beta-lactam-binding protein with PASTA domain